MVLCVVKFWRNQQLIISRDCHPHLNLYYLGAQTMKVLNRSGGSMDFIDIYGEIKASEKISIKLFILVLDWLHMLELIKSENGIVQRCS